MPNNVILPSSLFALILLPLVASAGEVESPEKFMSESYGWTISSLDNERGWGGRYKNFACFDDRLAPPVNKEESSRKRFGVQCQTKRVNRENLGAMIFVTRCSYAYMHVIRVNSELS